MEAQETLILSMNRMNEKAKDIKLPRGVNTDEGRKRKNVHYNSNDKSNLNPYPKLPDNSLSEDFRSNIGANAAKFSALINSNINCSINNSNNSSIND